LIPTVGFDLDMTLIDSRGGIKASLDALAAETGVFIDSALAVTRLGPPVEVELAHWFPAGAVDAASDRYRALYPDCAAGALTALPGAHESLAAVRDRGGRVIVVTGKHGPNARRNLAELGFAADEVFGGVFAEDKGTVLRREGAAVYVGDHVADVVAARTGGAVSVAVATGPYDADALREAGADHVLASLSDFPAWLDAHFAAADSDTDADADSDADGRDGPVGGR
jgi:phosphoglycolate phosphatase